MDDDARQLFIRIQRQLRALNHACDRADDLLEVRTCLRARFRELETVHGLLEAGIRQRSWMLSIERYVA